MNGGGGGDWRRGKIGANLHEKGGQAKRQGIQSQGRAGNPHAAGLSQLLKIAYVLLRIRAPALRPPGRGACPFPGAGTPACTAAPLSPPLPTLCHQKRRKKRPSRPHTTITPITTRTTRLCDTRGYVGCDLCVGGVWGVCRFVGTLAPVFARRSRANTAIGLQLECWLLLNSVSAQGRHASIQNHRGYCVPCCLVVRKDKTIIAKSERNYLSEKLKEIGVLGISKIMHTTTHRRIQCSMPPVLNGGGIIAIARSVRIYASRSRTRQQKRERMQE
ncbi:hypothetical protein Tco_1079925 [Tanacetum coccineum]|uniref:Uncharacterized protein n=1 Tax=Tanacetum coccineum TaxID=301880 RepID=A0ABQ5HUS4_9ASTR